MNKRVLFVAASVVVLVPILAHAQVVGVDAIQGGQNLATWWLQLIRWMFVIAFSIVGITLAIARHSLEPLLYCFLGALIAFGSPQLAQGMASGVAFITGG